MAAGLKRPDEIGRFERGEREPTLSVAMAVARGLGVSTQNLLAETELQLRDIRPSPRPTASGAEPQAKAEPQALALAVIVQDGLLLMTRRRLKEQVIGAELDWNLVVGKIEEGETPEQAAIREADEEVGLRVRAVQRIFDHAHPRSPDGRHFYYIGCEVIGGAPDLVDHEENREIHWATLEEADERVAPYGGFAEPVRAWIATAMVGSRR